MDIKQDDLIEDQDVNSVMITACNEHPSIFEFVHLASKDLWTLGDPRFSGVLPKMNMFI